MYTDSNNSGMFTASAVTAPKTLWLTLKHTGHKMYASFYPTAF